MYFYENFRLNSLFKDNKKHECVKIDRFKQEKVYKY